MVVEKKNTTPVKTAYLDGAAHDYDQKRFTTVGGRAIDSVEQAVLSSVLEKQDKSSRILDVGCGTGRFLLAVCEKGFSCEALDASPDMLEEAQKKIGEKYPETNFHLGDAANLPFENSAFDFVYSIRLLNQTGSATHALKVVEEMVRVAKPGSEILVEFVNYFRPRSASKSETIKNVYLKPNDVIGAGSKAGGAVTSVQGIFFLGMTAQHHTPEFFRPVLNSIERLLCAIFPRLCARCYILFEKSGE